MVINKLIIDEESLLKIIYDNLEKKKKLLITYFNQNCFNAYHTDTIYKKLLDDMFVVYPDGAGMYLALKLLFRKNYIQFNATDFNERVINSLITNNNSFFIIGGNFNKNLLYNKFNCSPGFLGYKFGYFNVEDYPSIFKEINHLNPDVIIIGMGVPKQEIFAYELYQNTNASIYLCVGNFLEFYFKTVKRIPSKYRNKGIEWLYRIMQDPNRLWKRYLIGIPLFIFRVIKYKFINLKTAYNHEK